MRRTACRAKTRFGLRTNAGRRHLDNRAVRAGFVVEIDRPLQLEQHGRVMATRPDTGGGPRLRWALPLQGSFRCVPAWVHAGACCVRRGAGWRACMKSHFRYSRARRRWLHTSRQCGIKRTRLETQPIRLGREVNRLSSANVHRLLARAGAPFRAGHVHYMPNVFNDAARRLCELAARHALQDGRAARCAGPEVDGHA